MEQAKNKIRIATAKSRYELIWKNNEVLWEELVKRLTNTTITSETLEQYKALPKKDQDAIKDIGGFVGGYLKNGRRKNGYVEARSLVTLDMDDGTPDILETIESFATQECVIYSTHKHTSAKPRIRLIFPLTREVSAEEYEPLARKIANDLGVGMDCFDDTTFEATRLMYWPSTSANGEFIGEELNGAFTNPDVILSEYTNWRDSSEWPTSTREGPKRVSDKDHAGEPTEKPFPIGAFCRVYSLRDALAKYLAEVYSPTENDNRYTFIGGSTTGGLIVYDDKWAYSNHGTDPAHGMLCNAFDLVRIHKFGNLDINVTDETPMHKRPSYKKMSELVAEDPEVRKLIDSEGREMSKAALEDFSDMLAVATQEPAAQQDEEWLKKLHYGKNGDVIEDYKSVLLILENDAKLKGLVGLNTFKGLPELLRKTPWERAGNEYWSDGDEAQLRGYLNTVYGIKNWGFVKDALSAVIEHNRFNPIKNYIESTAWDGIPRVDNLFIKYLGADDTPYVRTVTRKMLVAAVARIYHPGCKFDYMVTLVGKQGVGKSLLIYKLGNGWSSNSLPDLRSKASYEALDGVWIMEMGELVALKKTDRETIKNFISTTEDTYRKAYAKNVTVNKRTCIFIGTTNDTDFLNDSTGARRFLVIDTHEDKIQKRVWDGLDKEEVHQIWAEAKSFYDDGEEIMAMPEAVSEQAVSEQESHQSDNALVGIIGAWLEKSIPSDWAKKNIEERVRYFRATEDFNAGITKIDTMTEDEIKQEKRTRVCTAEIWCECLNRPLGDITKTDSWNIGEALKLLGWKRNKSVGRFGPYGSQRFFVAEVDANE